MRGRRRIVADDVQRLERAHLARCPDRLQLPEIRIEAAVEAEEQPGAIRAERRQRLSALWQGPGRAAFRRRPPCRPRSRAAEFEVGVGRACNDHAGHDLHRQALRPDVSTTCAPSCRGKPVGGAQPDRPRTSSRAAACGGCVAGVDAPDPAGADDSNLVHSKSLPLNLTTGAPRLNDRSAASARRSARSCLRGPVAGFALPSSTSAKWSSSARYASA